MNLTRSCEWNSVSETHEQLIPLIDDLICIQQAYCLFLKL